MHFVTFQANGEQIQRLAANAIEAVVDEEVNPKQIGIYKPPGDEHGFAIYIYKWHRKWVDVRISYHADGFSVCHGDFIPHRRRKWFKAYPSAVEWVNSVPNIVIVRSETALEHFSDKDWIGRLCR